MPWKLCSSFSRVMKKRTLFVVLVCGILIYVVATIAYFGTHTLSLRIFGVSPPASYLHPDKTYLEHSNSTGNVPDVYILDKAKRPSKLNDTCARFPMLLDLHFSNDYWQIQKTSNGTFHLFNAYLDTRQGRAVRVLIMYDQRPANLTFYCQLWYNKTNAPVIVESEQLTYLWRVEWGPKQGTFYHPYVVTCPLPEDKVEAPMSVSLVELACTNATNNMKVFHAEGEKKNFVVCVKGLAFPYEDISVRLIEWIELLGLLGAEKINFYLFHVHPNMERALYYYQQKGNIEVTPLTLVGEVSNHPYIQFQYLHKRNLERQLQEVIPYNDCLYKHLQVFKYVVLLDIDEVIVPSEGGWPDLMAKLQGIKPNMSSYVARNVYFLDSHLHQHDWFHDIPENMYMLQHVYRARNHTKSGFYVKGFHDLQQVVGLHNHFPFKCVGNCISNEIEIDAAQLQHYREDCAKGLKDCDDMKTNSEMDTRVWRFKDQLIERVQTVLKDLNFDSWWS